MSNQPQQPSFTFKPPPQASAIQPQTVADLEHVYVENSISNRPASPKPATRRRPESYRQAICETCGSEFEYHIKQQAGLYCSKKCTKPGPKKRSKEDGINVFYQKLRLCPETGCLEWTGGKNDKGYGSINIAEVRIYTHRLAYILAHGEIPDGLWVLHKCDNPPCCNPDHLFLGTDADNHRDMVNKGRHCVPPSPRLRGSQHGGSKLTEEQVRAARELYKTGKWSIAALARTNQVNRITMMNALRGKTWTHV